MTLILFIITGGLLALIMLLTSVQPGHSSMSLYELRRRQKTRDNKAGEALHRETLLAQLSALREPFIALILVLLTALLIYQLDWAVGILSAIIVGLFYRRFANVPLIRKLANGIYKHSEVSLLRFTARWEGKIRLLSGITVPRDKKTTLGSREELAHLLVVSQIFSEEDKLLLQSALRFKARKVSEVMTPRKEIISVKDVELLGPLVLDDLHKTGHTIFPVTQGVRIVGLLDSSDHVALRTKESVHVRSVMHAELTRIDQSTALDEALRTFITVKQPLLVVLNDDNEEVGIISLGDIIRALTGWKQR